MWSVLRRYQGVDHPGAQQDQLKKQQLQQQAENPRSIAAMASNSNTNKNQQQDSSSSSSNQQQQNLSESARRRKAFEHNQRTLALHEWHEHGKIDPNPPSLALPYDRYAYDKMLRLAAPQSAAAHAENSKSTGNPESIVEIQRKALSNLIQLLFEKPQNIHHLVKEPLLLPTIVLTSRDDDEDVRRATCVLLRLIAQDRKGAEFLFNKNKDTPADEALVKAVASGKRNALNNSNNNKTATGTTTTADASVVENVRRRLADVGEAVRCLMASAMDEKSCLVSTEALRALSAFHGFADTPEYTYALMRARCVPMYAEIIKAFRFSTSNDESNNSSNNNSQYRCCTAALVCLRLVTNAKEAFLDVLKEEVLNASLKIITEFVAVKLNQQQQQAAPAAATTTSNDEGKLLCAALGLVTELVLYTAGSNAAVKRQEDTSVQTILPCAKLARLHSDNNVRRDAAGALATLCVAESGKAAAQEARQEQGVIDLVRDSICHETDRDVVSSMCRVVCLLSELPAARQVLVDLAEPLKEIAANARKVKDASLEEGATRAAKLVVWVPGQE